MNNENNNNPNGLNSMVNQNAGINNTVNQNAGINNMVNQNAGNTQNVNQPVPPVPNPGVVETTSEEENEQVCSKCGFKLSKTSPICLHCGTPVAADSQKIAAAFGQEYNDNKEVQEEYLPGEEYLENKKKFLIPMLIINGVSTLFNIIGIILLSLMENNNTVSLIVGIVLGFIIVVTMFYQTCYQILLCKSSLPWWGLYIPGYNGFLLSKLMTGDYLYTLALIIPEGIFGFIAGKLQEGIFSNIFVTILGIALFIYTIIFVIKMNRRFAMRFNVSALALFFLPAIMIPYMAFNDAITCDSRGL